MSRFISLSSTSRIVGTVIAWSGAAAEQLADLANERVGAAGAFENDLLNVAAEPRAVLVRDVLTGENDHRNAAPGVMLAQFVHELEAVHYRHQQVEQHNRRRILPHPLQRIEA